MNIKRNIHAISLFTFALTTMQSVSAAVTAPTAQYVAKLYSEGLGRIPDQSGWHGLMSYLESNTCGTESLKAIGLSVLTSDEFHYYAPNNQEKIFKFYRATLSRDPTPADFSAMLSQLNGGVAWTTVINSFFASAEFANNVSRFCNNVSGWQAYPANNLMVPSAGSFQGTSGADLQRILNNTAPGATVFLAQGVVVRLDTTLVIPSGVTLATQDLPSRQHTARYGRLVRNSLFDAQLVDLTAGSTITHIWIDGQRNNLGFSHNSININANGSNIRVESNLITDSAGWTNMQHFGTAQGIPCTYAHVANNLVTAYGSKYNLDPVYNASWTDGLSSDCENATIEDNEVIDATDVGIVVYSAKPVQSSTLPGSQEIQKSIVRNNRILNAGNSARGALAADPLFFVADPDFTGTNFINNLIWSSSAVHYDIILANGTRPWFSTGSTGFGASFSGNTSGTEPVYASVGLAINGMKMAYMQGNVFNYVAVSGTCVAIPVAAAISAGFASFIPGGAQNYSDYDIGTCIH